MSDYSLVTVAYHRGTHSQTKLPKPYHWALFLRSGEDSNNGDAGIAHQLHGMPGSFHYDGVETIEDLCQSGLGSKCNEVDIENVPRAKLDVFAEICHAIPIEQDESSDWSCQSWTIAAVELWKKEGLIDEWIAEDYLRGYLREI